MVIRCATVSARSGKRSAIGGLLGLLLGAAGVGSIALLVGPTASTTSQQDPPPGAPRSGPGPGPGPSGAPGGPRPTTATTSGLAPDSPAPASSSPTFPQDPPPLDVVQADRVVRLVNQARGAAGCAALGVDDRVVTAARAHSADMASRGYFAHTSPEGVDFATRMREAGHPRPAGENIAMGQRSAEDVVGAWLDSEGHRRNILDCSFTTTGVGLDTRGWYWTQNFGR
ncbi:CAP domain-containing protein [Actinosynnema pretiosum subsp. pretiosum]|uniref:CAP domain-containing protein n=1 Tax=Actinosynnema pretiosum subsp. pretiosum TaxID=103721 RepID=A0AA45R2T4_9PSEU|nr:CAP domain-containing protein [Actinosynnema pretiosum subsp. pretiosum]